MLVLAVAIGTVFVLAGDDDSPHDHVEADQTAEVVTGSTVNTSYSLEPVLSQARDDPAILALEDSEDWDVADPKTRRIVHGTIAGQLADVAVANIRISGEHFTKTATDYERQLDETIQGRLLESDVHANLTAVWSLYDGSDVRGITRVGETPPPNENVSSTTITVPSGFRSLDSRLEGPSAGESLTYRDVARAVAGELVEGYLPAAASQRALEGTGLQRILTLNRYVQFARLAGTEVWDVLDREHLERASADSQSANRTLVRTLAEDVLAEQLRAEFDDPETAARSISLETVAITVRTWQE
jgi:hypothetical protein